MSSARSNMRGLRLCWPVLLVVLVAACAGPNAGPPAARTTIPSAVALVSTPSPAPSHAEPSAIPPTPSPLTTAEPSPMPAPITPTLSTTPEPAYDLVLVGGTLIDGSGGEPLADAVVARRGDRIVAVGRSADVSIPPGSTVRNIAGMTLLPGFVNAHAHSDTLTDDDLRSWTRAGITTVRDLGGPRDAMLRRGAALAPGYDHAQPRLLVAGPIVTVPNGHPIPVYGLNDEVLVVQGPDDARAQINTLIDDGADVVKIAVSGRTDVNWPELSDDEIRAIVETAHARGRRVAAHIDRTVALRRAVEQGIDDAAHMPRDHMPDDLIARMVERGVALVPTIAVYEALAEERGDGAGWRATVLLVMQDNLRRFVAAGGTLALGDDYGNPGVALGMPLAEIRHWLAAGLTPMQVIVAATQGGAVVCGLADQIGQVRPGMAADLLIVDGDPLQDIAALERVALVVHRGTEIVP